MPPSGRRDRRRFWSRTQRSQNIEADPDKAQRPSEFRIAGPGEGKLRNIWKPTRQEAAWFHGGNLHQSRHYSQYLALQLKARMEGLPTPVYALAEVHHRE